MTREEAIKDIKLKVIEAKAFEESYAGIEVPVLEIALEVLEKQMNAEDMASVKHGKWTFGTARNTGWMKCSNCRRRCQIPCRIFSYCPNCGAKMNWEE